MVYFSQVVKNYVKQNSLASSHLFDYHYLKSVKFKSLVKWIVTHYYFLKIGVLKVLVVGGGGALYIRHYYESKLQVIVSEPEELPRKLRETTYFSLARSSLENSVTVWHPR